MPERFGYHLFEAVETLAYYRIDALDLLLDMYRAAWPKGLSATMFRDADIRPLLSEKGLPDPHHAQKATYLRATFSLRREEFQADERHWSGYTKRVSFAARSQWLCDRARALDGSIVEAGERWALPFPDCGQDWCPCRWDVVPEGL